MVENIYLGPVDTVLVLANFNLWGLFMTFLSVVFQYKSSVYEVAKSQALEQGLDIAVLYPYSKWYKTNGLRTLQISLAINAVTVIVFWTTIFPNSGEDF